MPFLASLCIKLELLGCCDYSNALTMVLKATGTNHMKVNQPATDQGSKVDQGTFKNLISSNLSMDQGTG